MFLTIAGICVAAFCVLLFVQRKRSRDQQQVEAHSISAEALRPLLETQQVLLYDVRQPLDLLANSEIIPGAKRIPPKEILANPHLIPMDQDTVIYCTCPTDKTSLIILERALKLGFQQVKFLQGGLESWKNAGFPVEPYKESFHLDTGT